MARQAEIRAPTSRARPCVSRTDSPLHSACLNVALSVVHHQLNHWLRAVGSVSPWSRPWLSCLEGNSSAPFLVVGSGLAGVSRPCLRQRWPLRPIHLLAHANRLDPRLAKALQAAEVRIMHQPAGDLSKRTLATSSAGLICCGSRAPGWLAASGLPCCSKSGRIRTNNQLQVIEHPELFASGDCALIDAYPRPPSGVWAVRASVPLARNLGLLAKTSPCDHGHPRQALQLLGDSRLAGLAQGLWGHRCSAPTVKLWWKQRIDLRFMQRFQISPWATRKQSPRVIRCSAAAVLPNSQLPPWKRRLPPVWATWPQPGGCRCCLDRQKSGALLLQSVDGFRSSQ